MGLYYANHSGKFVAFHYLGYPPIGDNELLRLPGTDGEHGGIGYEVGLHACATFIINGFDGYFTDTTDSRQDGTRVIPEDDILPPRSTCFSVPPLARYPLFESRVYASGSTRIIDRIRKSRFNKKASRMSCCPIYRT